MVINPNISALDNLLALINEYNPGVHLTSSNVTIGPVAENDDVGEGNTSVVIYAIKNNGYSDSTEITYNRVGIEEGMVKPIPMVIDVSQATTAEEVKSAVCLALGLVNDATVNVYGKGQGELTAPEVGRYGVAELSVSDGSILYTRGDEIYEIYLGDPTENNLAWNTSDRQTWDDWTW